MRRDVVKDRIADIVSGFDRYVAEYDRLVPFDSEQLRRHRETIALRRDAGSVLAAVADPRFVSSLKATLTEWGLHQRGSRLAAGLEFQAALEAALPDIVALEPFYIDASDLPTDLAERLWVVIDGLGITENQAKIVAGTKALHHLLPDLVPPMDRAWTGMLFKLHGPEWQSRAQRATFQRLYDAFRFIAEQAHPGRLVTGEGWRTSRTKILDNAIIGYCKTSLGGQRATGPITTIRPQAEESATVITHGPRLIYEPVLLSGSDESVVHQGGAFVAEAEAQKVLDVWRAEGRQEVMAINIVPLYETAEQWATDR